MRRPATLLFDLDGTLVDSAVTIAQALTELSLARGGGPADVAQIRRLVSQGAPVLVRETLGAIAGDSAEDLAAFRAILTEIPPPPGMVFPGAIDALGALSEAGHACAVVTNKPEKLACLLLDQLDLSRFFVGVVGGDTLPVGKPDPAPLLHALQALSGSATGDAAMIGDSDIDARAAAAARIPFVLFLGGYEPDRCEQNAIAGAFARFEELPALLRRLTVSESKVMPRGLATG